MRDGAGGALSPGRGGEATGAAGVDFGTNSRNKSDVSKGGLVGVALAIIVIDDAARLRMYMGDQGRYLNMLIRQLNVNEEQFPRLKERMGHRVSEVIVGGIYGFLLTILLVNLLA